MKTLNRIAKWFWIGVFAFLAGVWFGMPMLPKEQGYTRKEVADLAALIDRSTAEADARASQKAKPVVLYRTEAERNRAIAEVFMAGRSE